MQNCAAEDTWFAQHLFDPHSWYPERIGRQHIIFARPAEKTLVSMAIDPAPQTPNWICPSGLTPSESFFFHLRPWVAQDASFAFLTYPDGAWIELHGHHPLNLENWSPWMLRFFEETPAAEGGAQMLVVLLRNKSGAIIFSRFAEFEIAYYGPDNLWAEIASALYGGDKVGL